MIIRSIATVLLVGAASVNSPLAAQDKKIAEPETIGVVYYIDSVAGFLILLERQIAKIKSGIRYQSAQINGEKSPVRLTSELLAGEYGFSPTDSNDVFAFGIDSGKN